VVITRKMDALHVLQHQDVDGVVRATKKVHVWLEVREVLQMVPVPTGNTTNVLPPNAIPLVYMELVFVEVVIASLDMVAKPAMRLTDVMEFSDPTCRLISVEYAEVTPPAVWDVMAHPSVPNMMYVEFVEALDLLVVSNVTRWIVVIVLAMAKRFVSGVPIKRLVSPGLTSHNVTSLQAVLQTARVLY